MDSVIEGLKYVCRCCRLFVSEKKSQIYAINDCLICNSIMSKPLTLFYIDSYTIFDNNICLCLTCSRSFLLENQPKFGIFNGLSYVNFQSYSPTLADLSIVKEVGIARTYPIVSIFKLRF